MMKIDVNVPAGRPPEAQEPSTLEHCGWSIGAGLLGTAGIRMITPDNWFGSVAAAFQVVRDPEAALKGFADATLDGILTTATAEIGAMFESPAAPMFTTLHMGVPHSHPHPPGIPLFGIGPLLFGGCVSVRIGPDSQPAARSGDFGVAATCCGTFPFFQVVTGSSKVFVGGKRAARMLDLTKHCLAADKAGKGASKYSRPPALKRLTDKWDRLSDYEQEAIQRAADLALKIFSSDEATARSVAKVEGRREAMLRRARTLGDAVRHGGVERVEDVALDLGQDRAEIESLELQSQCTAEKAATGIDQTVVDAVTSFVKIMAGKDPGGPPGYGLLIPLLPPKVTMGGFPMPSWDFLYKGLGKVFSKGKSAFTRLRDPKSGMTLRKMAQGTFSPARLRESIAAPFRYLSGDPVDVITGAVVTDAVDAVLRGGYALAFTRHYSSAWSERDSALGFGWSASIDQALWLERGQVVVRIEDGRELCFEHEDGVDPRRRGLVLALPAAALRLRALGDGRWELLGGDGARREFAPIAGDAAPLRGVARLVRMQGPEAHTLTFEYDDDARIRAVCGPGGRRLGVRRGPQGRIAALTLPRPEGPGDAVVARYDYSIDGDLIAVTDACGGCERFVYDDHRLVEAVRADGQRFFFTYDGPGSEARCVRAWGEGEVHVRDFVYNRERRMTVVTHGAGQVAVVHADGWGRLAQIDDARGGSRRFEYDALGRRIAEVDPLGYVRRFEYDDLGRPTREVDADGAARSLEYDLQGRVIAAVDPLGGRARNLFDGDGRLAAVIDAQGAAIELQRAGRATIRRDAEGRETRIDHDEHGLPTRIDAPTGGCWRITYDRRGRPIELVDPRGRSERRRHDACDRLIAVDALTGERRSYERDASGRITAIHGDEGTIERTYHPSRALGSRRDGDGTLTCVRDGDGDLLGLTRGDGASHTLSRDPKGVVIGETTFDGRTLAYERDLGDRITAVVTASGARTEYVHDEAGRVIEVRHADGARERFAYRGDGRMIAASREEDGVVDTVEIERDRLGRVTREVQGAGWIASERDRSGRRRRLTSSGGLTVAIDRDGAGRPGTITVEQGGRRWQVRIARDPAGAEVERALPGEVTASWERDALGRPGARTIVGPLAAPSSWDQSLGRPRGVLGERDHAWSSPRGLRAITEDGAVILDREAPPREPEAAGVAHVHDADGRVIERVHADGRVDRLRWDGAHRLREVITAAGVRVRDTYDALGRRIRRQVGEVTTTWLWDGDLPVHEITTGPEGMSQRTWLFDPESWAPLAVLVGDPARGRVEMIGVISDLVGAPMMAVDERGAVVWRGAPDRRGAAIAARAGATIDLPLQFPGQFADPLTGLHDNRHRVYDPAAGSYLSADPLGLAGGLRPHAYVDDPWTMIDPLGQAQRSVLDDADEGPGATTYQAPRPPAVDALLDRDEPSPLGDALLGFAATAAVTGVVLGGTWIASKRCR